MTRPLRINYPGAWYHVMNRGRRREKVFATSADYKRFIKVLKETTDYLNLKIVAYCLMPNHYHLLVQTPDGNLPRCMRHLNGVYTQRYNRHHKTEGQLFRGRYKAVLVDADSYLLEVLRYIHRNPLQARMVENLSDFQWSSHHAYLSRAKQWQWLEREFLLNMLSSKKNNQSDSYLEFVTHYDSKEIKHFYSLKNLPSILGGVEFKDWLTEKFSHLGFQQEIPDSKSLTPPPEKIITTVCQHFRITQAQLFKARRGKENIPRDIAIYQVRHLTGKTLTSVGKYFGITNYSTVSSAIERVKNKITKDESLAKKLKTITNKATKSQGQT